MLRILWLLACGHRSVSGHPFSPPETNEKSGDRKCVFIRRLGGLGGCRLVQILLFDSCYRKSVTPFLAHARETWCIGITRSRSVSRQSEAIVP